MTSIGILGGTFDPIHQGHLEMARIAMAEAGLREIRFMPAWAHKRPDAASALDRVEMIRLAIADEQRFSLCDLEIATQGKCFTFDLIIRLRASLSSDQRLCWIMGADSLRDMPTRWTGGYAALDLCQFLIIPRAGVDLSPVPPEARRKVSVLQTSGMDISSTEIRRRVGAGESIDTLVPLAVACYIATYGLY
ncbi:nicotinate (nicotinamide) nucleotide adenylyltransferase [Candidatus Uhrbacteria bacterium]|nr:nicotinate (nicotinamide) nucleotide adenylyltransferase [Candidatus Uhrbacteria bacterium]